MNEISRIYFPGITTEGIPFDRAIDSFRRALSFSFLAGYLVEKTLSLDNLFVILMILTSFKVPLEQYKKILFWGIFGAVVLRFVFIFLGAALINRFDWILYIFGGFLLLTGGKMLIQPETKEGRDVKNHPLVRIAKKFFSVSEDSGSGRFFIRKNNKTRITTLFLVLILIEFTDLLFAMDSIPAIFGITRDPYIVFYSNIFAILGLRSMFFLIANLSSRFHFLKSGISILLLIIGLKLILHHWVEEIGFRPVHSLIIISIIIGTSILLSIILPSANKE